MLVGAAISTIGITGCSTWHQKTAERSEGRMVDDHKIASGVKTKLKEEPVYKFSDVAVRTFDGVVQLSGFVNTDDQKRRAAELAQQVPGVVEVQNNISLKPNTQNFSPTGRNPNINASGTINENPNNTTNPNRNTIRNP
jgi:hypothetical protein